MYPVFGAHEATVVHGGDNHQHHYQHHHQRIAANVPTTATTSTSTTPPSTRNWRLITFNLFQMFTRFWGVFTSIVLCGVGIDIVVHKHTTGYYFIGGGILLFLLEVTWLIGLFLRLCIQNDEHRIFRCWSVVQWFECWKKTLLYGPLGALPIIFPHNLWLSYVAAGQLITLAAFYLLLSFKGARRRRRKDRLLHPELDSYESSRFEEVTEVLDDGLPEPMPGSSHSLSDSLVEQDTILEI